MRVLVALLGVGILVVGCTGPAASDAAAAQRLVDRILAAQPHGSPAAAAYVSTTYAAYAGSLPDRAGLPSAPASSDSVLVVEVEGWFPNAHKSAPGASGDSTAIIVSYDETLGTEIGWTYAFAPGSADIPGSHASPRTRFIDLRRLGTPNLLRVVPGDQSIS